MNIAIIGSAGRGHDIKSWSREKYYGAFKTLKAILASTPVEERNLVSGGSAWADHLAVSLFLAGEATSLTLHVPCKFEYGKESSFWSPRLSYPRYEDNGEHDAYSNPGGILNHYHRLFSEKMEANTMGGIAQALERGAQMIIHPRVGKLQPLLTRNLHIGKDLDKMLALTWGENEPFDSGTGHCWRNSNCKNKVHISLRDV